MRIFGRKEAIDTFVLAGVIPEEAWRLLSESERAIMLILSDYMEGRFDHVELERRVAHERQIDAAIREGKWHDQPEIRH